MTRTYLWFALILTFVFIEMTGRYIKVVETEKFLYPPPEEVEKFTFGFHESFADSFWLRWIQDADVCQTYLKPVEKLHPTKDTQTPLYAPRYKNCDNSWAFKMLDAVTKLAPQFKMPYLAGGISLSVLTEDYEGATIIFDRGLREYPKDWSLAYRAAYHYMFDLGNHVRAAELLLAAAQNGAPDWLSLLASRIYSEAGQIEVGISTLESYKAGLKDEKSVEIIEKRIKGLRDRLKSQEQPGEKMREK